jgi:hypothetical protein
MTSFCAYRPSPGDVVHAAARARQTGSRVEQNLFT